MTRALASVGAETETAATEPSDLELVVRAQKGDTEAFSELVKRHQHLVYNLAYRFMRENALAEDMAQEAFLKAYRLLKGFRGDCSFSTWLYRVTVSVCLTELNRRKKRQEVEFHPFHERREVMPSTDTSDLGELIQYCIRTLPHRYNKIVTLYYIKQMSYDDIAEAMRIPMGTLKTWMHRARNQLRRLMEKEFDLHGTF